MSRRKNKKGKGSRRRSRRLLRLPSRQTWFQLSRLLISIMILLKDF